MSTVQEIEFAIEQLSPEVFSELVEWVNSRRGKSVRKHSAFLNSYIPEDEVQFTELQKHFHLPIS